MLKLIFFILFSNFVYASSIIIDENTSNLEILSHSYLYKDNTKSLTIDDIQKNDISFKKNNYSRLSFGYSPDLEVWVKFTLQNKSDKTLKKIIEYENSLTTHISFFDPSLEKHFKDGILQINQHRKTVNPYFEISLEPKERKTFYIKASSHITTLIIQLNLWENQEFYNKELKHQSILELFFGAMLVLALYNLFIYFFTKDISYFFYVMYIFGVIYHQLLYTGISYVYLIPIDIIPLIIELSPLASGIPIIALAFFCKYFLKIKQYQKTNMILNVFLILTILSILIPIITHQWNNYRNIMSMILIVYLIIVTAYAISKKNRQAYFIFAGWICAGSAALLMYLNSIGTFNIYQYYPYFMELAFIAEALLFSVALADKINQLQYEKNKADKKLIIQQQTEKERLIIEVEVKTTELQNALSAQMTLLKELNHRVKNNMQTIISLVRLQSDEVEDKDIQEIFTTIQNRINAMSYLHELLYKQSDISHVNVYEYFENLITGLQDSYENELEIFYDISIDLKVETAISCGLIVNELITNSFKYAFPKDVGHIWVQLYKKQDTFYLTVQDDGIGYEDDIEKHTFGLKLVKTLVEDHLKGKTISTTKNGVKNQIIWRDYA